jgi:hypothetical protein
MSRFVRRERMHAEMEELREGAKKQELVGPDLDLEGEVEEELKALGYIQ